MKKFLVKSKRAIAFLLLFLVTFTWVMPAISTKADSKQFTINVKVGYDDRQEVNVHMPVVITVTNNGADFTGTIQLTVAGRDGNIMYEQDLKLAKGATKKIEMAPMNYVSNNEIRVAIVNEKGKVLAEERPYLSISSSRNYIRVGVLSEDYQVARLFDNMSYKASSSSLLFTTVNLSEDNIYESFEAMDSLDVIVISDFSTDILSEKQIKAILDWAEKGGLLLIGAGDSYKKTLSGFENLLQYTDKGMIDVITDYAANNDTLSKGSYYSSVNDKAMELYLREYDLLELLESYINSSIGDNKTVYEQMCSDLKDAYKEGAGAIIMENYTEALWEAFALEFAQCFYHSSYWLEKDGVFEYPEFKELMYDAKNGYESVYYTRFKTYCQQEVCTALAIKHFKDKLDTMVDPFEFIYQTNQSYTGEVQYGDEHSYVEASIWDFAFGNNFVNGIDKKTGKEIGIYQIAEYGEGFVVMAAMDFSKKPFSTYSSNATVLINLCGWLIGEKMENRMLSYDSSLYNYSNQYYEYKDFLNQLHTNKPVPIIAYLVVFVVYIIASFFMYGFLKKKQKSLLLWPIVAGFALIASLLVFFVSFSSKAIKPTMNVVKIVDGGIQDGTVSSYCTITLPKNKIYRLSFNDNLAMSYVETSYSYSVSMEPLDTYKIGFSKKNGEKEIIINKNGILSSRSFIITDNDSKHGEIKLYGTYSNGKLVGKVTNNYGYDLENCCIILDACIANIGKLKAGETVDLSTLKLEGTLTQNIYWSDVAEKRDQIIFGKANNAGTVLLGVGGKESLKRNSRINALAYLVNQTDINFINYYGSSNSVSLDSNNLPMITTSKLLFVGFNDRSEGITKEGVTEVVTELVYKEARQ